MDLEINNFRETIVESLDVFEHRRDVLRMPIKLPELEIDKKKAKLINSSVVSREAGKLQVYLLIECEETMKKRVRKDIVELHRDPRLDIEFTLPSHKKSARK